MRLFYLLLNLFNKEKSYYQKLSPEGQKLFISYFIFSISSILIGFLVATFLWRETKDIFLIAIFNLTTFIGVSTGFYINGRLMKSFLPTKLYLFGCILHGLVIGSLIFIPHISYLLTTIYGFLFGIAGGFFWSNRNLLTLNATKSHQRIYFSGLETVSNTVSAIIIPIFVGWLIVFSPTISYQALVLILNFLMVLAGILAQKVQLEKSFIDHVSIRKSCKNWTKLRIFTFILGMSNGIELVLPALMVFVLIGKENTLGTIQSLSGIFLAFVLYQLAKKTNQSHRYLIFSTGVILSIMASLIFSLSYSALGVFCYFIINACSGAFRWIMVNPITFDAIDLEKKHSKKHHYSFIFDQQLFLNLGRSTALILFLFFFHLNQSTALRITPLLFAIPQLILLWIVPMLEKNLLVADIMERLHYLTLRSTSKAYIYNRDRFK